MSATATVDAASLLAGLPPVPGDSPRAEIREQVARSGSTLVVLDDDPTGTQTVYDVPVLTVWDAETLAAELALAPACLYILTNSRSLPEAEAQALVAGIADNLKSASESSARRVAVVSRGDSTLRGHFPAETDALSSVLGPFDATLVFPYFEAGGRFTISDVHYVAEGETLVPASQTPFARDAAFGYRSSDLREWIEEKTAGRVRADAVASVGLADLRGATPSLPHDADYMIANACHPRDAEALALATLKAEAAGSRFLYRTAASFVSARLGLEPRPLWQPPVGDRVGSGGLTVVGSHVPLTSTQLTRALGIPGIVGIELDVPALLADGGEAVLAAAATTMNAALADDRDVVVFTSRALVAGGGGAESLAIGKRVSSALVELVRRLATRPRYLIAKGGITSSDLATRGLAVRRALVAGQILPGVPVWKIGDETRFPRLPYIVFPGNVGGPDALASAIRMFAQS